MLDLSSPTRDRTHVSCIGRQILNHWTTSKVLPFIYIYTNIHFSGSSENLVVKNLPAMQETWVLCLGWEDPLGKGVATYSRILAWRVPWTEEPDGLQSMGSQRVGHDWATNTLLSLEHKLHEDRDFCLLFTVVSLVPGRVPGTSHGRCVCHCRKDWKRDGYPCGGQVGYQYP